MSTQEFGGEWTIDKHTRVRKYLEAYSKIFTTNVRAKYYTTVYVDAFAGTGYRFARPRGRTAMPLFPELSKPDAQSFTKGSARIALEVQPGFDRYLFIERDPGFARELTQLRAEFPEKAQAMEIVSQDANSYLTAWCQKTNWKRTRAVVFLDPYGMQVEWQVLEAIARTRAIDLWLLFPLGMAVNRLLTRAQPPPIAWAKALTRIFGTEEWRAAFYPKQEQQTLFGPELQERKQADFDRISTFFVKRLGSIFPKVAPNPLPLRNSTGTPIYLLCFAAGNPAKGDLAVRIASNILKP